MTLTAEQSREPLAIVGIGCRLPGGANSPEDFWQLLCGEVDATREVPEKRWNAARFYDSNPKKAGKMVTRRGGYLEDIDQFDAQFFGMSPREANLLDPQQRLLLQTTWEAFEDGGIPADELAGTPVGVFIGGFTLDYQLLQNQGRTSRFRFKTHSATGMMMTMLANRISFAFDFRGPSMAIDTACSSSLVAVHLAAQSIWNGECELALAGGVNVIVGPNTAIAESKSGFLSPDGRCKAFDDSADGYARGEGGAVVVIKPLSEAVRDGDRVYAEILGTAVNQDGHTDGITVPSGAAQRSAISVALQRAGVTPNEIGYVEAHGTGTPVGDPVEMQALAGALASDRDPAAPLLIGSVKTNIGHLEAGAGVAGLIKTALVLKHGFIPANLHLENPSRRIPFAELNVDVPRTGRAFPGTDRRLAGVNSFGFGGTNAHVVLAEPSVPVSSLPSVDGRPSSTPMLLPISTRSEEALAPLAGRLAEFVRSQPDVTLADLGYNLGQRRSHLTVRRTITALDVDDAAEQLDGLAASGGQPTATRSTTAPPKLAFVCTGMGPQWWKMCRGLLDVFPAFTESIRRTDRELSRYADWSLLEELRRDEADSRMAETEFAQPANFAVQVALAAQLAEFGVTPDAVIGHSAGEVAAHHLAGLLTFEQAVHVIYHRSRLQQRTTGLGRMLAVGLSAEQLMQTIGTLDGQRVSVAAINSPNAVTVAGDADALDDVARRLDETNVFNRFLPVKVPYHTHYMELVRDDLYAAFDGLSSAPARIPLYSTVTGEQLTDYSAGAAYWWQNTRATVLFEPAARRMLDDGYTHFVELGPHPVLASSLLEIAGAQGVSVLATQRRNDDDARSLLTCVGSLYTQGCEVAWDVLTPRHGARLFTLPTYPWQNRRFWNEPPEAAEDLHYVPVHSLLGQPVSGVHPTWEVELNATTLPFLTDHRVQGTTVVPGAVFLEMASAAASLTYGASCGVDDLVLHRALILDDTCDPIVRTTLNQDKGTVEIAAFTATGDGDFTWSITATAELSTLPPRPARIATTEHEARAGADASLSGDEFYARTTDIGFEYGPAFQTVADIAAGEEWARAEIVVPATVADELDAFSFHPVLIDGAFQALFGTTFGTGNANTGTYLPTRIRQSAVFATPEHRMTVHVRVMSASSEEIESDITIADRDGNPLAVLNGFTVQSLSASSAMSTDRIDKGLYEVQWIPKPTAAVDGWELDGTDRSWLVFSDTRGVGTTLAQQLRSRGHRVQTVVHQPVAELSEFEGGFVTNPCHPDQLRELVKLHIEREGELAGIVDCWPLDMPAQPDDDGDESTHRLGVFTVLHLVNALAELEGKPRLHIVTANAQPAAGTESGALDQAALWGLGRVVGHQEFAENWGGLIDIEDGSDEAVAEICRQVLGEHDGDREDQIAIRGAATLVPRLRPCEGLTKQFPTKLTANATYVVTGGAGALGRVVAGYLAERGARHIALLNRRPIPPRTDWPQLTEADPHFATVQTIRRIEDLGANVSWASVDITDAGQVRRWLDDHAATGGRPVRGVIHTAGAVEDRLLVNMTEDDFTKVMAPKVAGTRVLDAVFDGHDLEFFVMFGSAGSVIASPGQGNYAAANAYLDAFAHHRRARGLPGLTIGWGPWSVGMVEELKLEKIYAQRGIELITPRAGARILDRLIQQNASSVVAITADWSRARQAGLGVQLPPMFSELEAFESTTDGDPGTSVADVLSGIPEAERLGVVTGRVAELVAAVFDCAVSEVRVDESLDDLGLDSMMAMEFRLRINATFSVDLPVLEILRGVSVESLADRILRELPLSDGGAELPLADTGSDPTAALAAGSDIDDLIDQLSEEELRELLAEIGDPSNGGVSES